MEFDELLRHLADLRDLATSEGFITFADACDDVVMFVEARPDRFDRRLAELPAPKQPIALVSSRNLDAQADAAARDEDYVDAMDRVAEEADAAARRALKRRLDH